MAYTHALEMMLNGDKFIDIFMYMALQMSTCTNGTSVFQYQHAHEVRKKWYKAKVPACIGSMYQYGYILVTL